MSVHVALPGEAGVTAGIEFIDGVAIVDDLSPNARAYLELVGATITEDVTVVEGVPLEDLTVPKLRAAAKDAGVEVAPKASKAELIAAIAAADLPVLTSED